MTVCLATDFKKRSTVGKVGLSYSLGGLWLRPGGPGGGGKGGIAPGGPKGAIGGPPIGPGGGGAQPGGGPP